MRLIQFLLGSGGSLGVIGDIDDEDVKRKLHGGDSGFVEFIGKDENDEEVRVRVKPTAVIGWFSRNYTPKSGRIAQPQMIVSGRPQ